MRFPQYRGSFLLLLLLPFLGMLPSCSEDFTVDAPYKSVTVIYGLMDMRDSAHYIRIQKAFVDENKSAIDIAKITDSSFYSSLNVHLKEMNGATMLADEILPRVDLNTEGAIYKKDTGTFFNNYSYAYKSKRVLNPAYTYRLVVTNTATGETDSAETDIIPNSYSDFRVDVLSPNNIYRILSFSGTSDADAPFKLSVTAPHSSSIYEGYIRIHYVDKDAAGRQTDDSVDWRFASGSITTVGQSTVVLSTSQQTLYPFLRDAIGPAPTNIMRFLDSADVTIWAGTPVLAAYQQINGMQGGLTADQIRPLYTNIRGANTIGIFTSRTRIDYRTIPFTDPTLDSIKSKLPILNFIGRSDH